MEVARETAQVGRMRDSTQDMTRGRPCYAQHSLLDDTTAIKEDDWECGVTGRSAQPSNARWRCGSWDIGVT